MDECFYCEMIRKVNREMNRFWLFGTGFIFLWLSSFVNSSATPKPIPKPHQKIPFSILFVGDVMVARGVAQRNHNQWNRPLEPVVSILKKSTWVVGNLESPLTTQSFKGGRSSIGNYDLRANPAAVAALYPFTFLNLQNNHALDGGILGLEQTRYTLSKAGIVPLEGFYKTTLGTQPITLFSWMDSGMDQGKPLPLEEIKQFARGDVRGDVLLIAYVHWGSEYTGITPRQRELARQLVDAGADLIVGTGPHVVQPLEYISNGKKVGVPVAYSLGNFLFDQRMPATRAGLMLRASWSHQKWYLERIPTRIQAGQVKLKTSS
jgi:poly-gamma-glutamate capsule biosynthesis protein CapA/YwtB (metallophosphatase superfamily)